MSKPNYKGIEGKARILLNLLSDPAVIIDQKGLFLMANDAFGKATGLKPKELIGTPFLKYDVLPAESKAILLQNLSKRLQGSPVTPYEVQYTNAVGEKRFVEVKGKRINYSGQPADLVVFHDITRRKENAKRLEEYAERMEALVEEKIKETKESEEKFRAISASAMDAIILMDDKAEIVYWNPAATRIFGYTEKEAVGKNLEKLLFPPQQYGLHSRLSKVFSGKKWQLKGKSVKFSVFSKNGTEVPIELSASTVELRNKRYLLGIIRDVSEHKKAEENLRESEEKLRRIIESSPDPIVVSSSDAKILDCNPAALKTFGYSTKSEVIGRNVFEFFAEKERAKATENLAREGENARNVEYLFQAKNGREFVGELSFCPILQPSGKIASFVSTIRDTTERKEKEKALRESEERFKQVAENAEEWIWEVDAHGMYTYSSPVVEKILGYKPEEIVGKKRFYDLFHPENREELMNAALKAFEQKQPFHGFINRNVHRNGEVVWLSTSGVPLLDWQGTLVGYRGADTNITEFKKAEEALRISEETYRALINGMNDTAWVIDLNGNFIDVNDAAVKVLGYSREELLSMGPTDIDSSLSKKQIKNLVKRMPADQIQVFETSHTTKDGKKIPVEISSSLVTYQGKRTILSIARDITERKKAEQALVESEAKFRTLAEQSPYMVFVNKKGRVVYANKMCEENMGYTKEEFYSPNFNFFCLIAPESREQIKSVYAQHIKNEKDVGPLEYRLVTKNGRIRGALLTSRLITYEGDKAIMGTVVDITERIKMQKKLEKYSRHLEETVEKRTKELKKAQANLLKAERLAAIGELAGMVGHDLRNPLTGIKNAAYYLKTKRRSSFDANGKKMLEIIDSAVTRADKIIGDLQEYSREMHLDLARCSPRSILKEALTLVQIPSRVKIVDNVPDEPLVRADKTKMVRVFMSIIKNAVDAMPDGGTLKIKSIQVDGNVEISFADTGIGIPKEALSKLFSPLVTTKAQGMGFGLAICKRIVDAHQGQITVQSVEGKGSTFTVIIPIEPKPKDASESAWINLPKSFLLKKKKKQKAKSTK